MRQSQADLDGVKPNRSRAPLDLSKWSLSLRSAKSPFALDLSKLKKIPITKVSSQPLANQRPVNIAPGKARRLKVPVLVVAIMLLLGVGFIRLFPSSGHTEDVSSSGITELANTWEAPPVNPPKEKPTKEPPATAPQPTSEGSIATSHSGQTRQATTPSTSHHPAESSQSPQNAQPSPSSSNTPSQESEPTSAVGNILDCTSTTPILNCLKNSQSSLLE